MKTLLGYLIFFLTFCSAVSFAGAIHSFPELEKEFKKGAAINIVLDFTMCKLENDSRQMDKGILPVESSLISLSSVGGSINEDRNSTRTMTVSAEDSFFVVDGKNVNAVVLKKTLMINSDSIVKFVMRSSQARDYVLYSCDWRSLTFGF